ncbi:hypothetical protein PV367_46995, partial [Streptomyces europaeiscabiei]
MLSAHVRPAHTPPGPAPYFADVLARLGWRADLPEARVAEIWEQERRTAYALTLPLDASAAPRQQQSPSPYTHL